MKEFIELITTYDVVAIIVILILVLVSIKQIWELISWFKSKIDKHHENQNEQEDEKEDLENRIKKLEEHDKWQYNKLTEITDLIVKMQNKQNIVTIATCRSSLYRLHSEFIAQGYLTPIQYETFKDLADVYISSGGNHTMANKLIPEVLELPIKDEFFIKM